jgi:integrase/recombinase XerD
MADAIAIRPTVQQLDRMDPINLATMGFLARYKGRTLEAYTLDLKHFFAWCACNGLPPLQARRPHLELYLRALEQHGYASATINRRFNTVALFYKYALRDEIINKDPAAFIDRPKIDTDGQRRTFLPPLQHGIFMAQAAECTVMEYALACLLGLRGMRVSAACNLNVGDVHSERGYDVITYVAKGDKRMTQALPVEAARAVRAAIGDRTEGPLLLNKRGRRMDRAAATRIIRKIAAAAKVDTNISPHSLRRSFITTGLASGIPAREMQLAAGHAQINTTMLYDRRASNPDRDAAHRVASHLAGFRG